MTKALGRESCMFGMKTIICRVFISIQRFFIPTPRTTAKIKLTVNELERVKLALSPKEARSFEKSEAF